MRKQTVAVIGGGISGVAATYYLARRGFEVELIERDDTLGGRMGSAWIGEQWVALGGKNVGVKHALAREFMEAMGATWDKFDVRWGLLRDGAVKALDVEQVLARATRLDTLLWSTIYTIAKKSERDRSLGGPWFSLVSRLADSQSLARYFSPSFTRDMLAPLTVRMNGAEADECYLGNLGSNLGMVLSTPMSQLRDGPHPVFERFASTHEVLLGQPVERLIVESGRVVGLVRGGVERRYDRVVVATPASVAQRLLQPVRPELANLLGAIRYFPVGLVVAEYEAPVFTNELTSIVFEPGSSPLSNVGAYGTEQRHLVRLTFSGRRAREVLARNPSSDELIEIAEREVSRMTPLVLPARRGHISRVWQHGLCAYAPHQHRNERRIRAELARMPGLHLTGDYVRGAAINTCFQAAHECVEAVAQSFPS